MNKAELIVAMCSASGVVASSLAAGYCVLRNGRRMLFDSGDVTTERRNDKGRVTYCLSSYSDGSSIEFTFTEARGAKFKAIAPAQLEGPAAQDTGGYAF